MINLSIIKFDDKGLVPAVAQDAISGEVLMLAYMNREALEKTLETGRAHYWSRSRGKLWLKGETSGHFQDIKSTRYDCDADAILLLIDQTGAACHTGQRSCFYRKLDGDNRQEPAGAAIVSGLFEVLKGRKNADPELSYVASLYKKGTQKILYKVEEESTELIEAALSGVKKEIVHETADLLFHTMVLLANEGVEIEEIYEELGRRFGTSGHEEKNSRPQKKVVNEENNNGDKE